MAREIIHPVTFVITKLARNRFPGPMLGYIVPLEVAPICEHQFTKNAVVTLRLLIMAGPVVLLKVGHQSKIHGTICYAAFIFLRFRSLLLFLDTTSTVSGMGLCFVEILAFPGSIQALPFVRMFVGLHNPLLHKPVVLLLVLLKALLGQLH